jgi:AraC family transcriptional regulator of adaptative response/methylated-DNA-[protein]-cysteine methyltransferase
METIEYGFSQSPFGPIIVARSTMGICDLQFLGFARMEVIHELGTRWGVYTPTTQNDEMAQQVERVVFEHERKPIILDLRGTDFQKEVWRQVRLIPFGHTATYHEIAAAVGCPDDVEAVEAALDANPLAVLVPCHRVVRSDGSLGSYHWGHELKQRLLDWEQQELKRLGDEPSL